MTTLEHAIVCQIFIASYKILVTNIISLLEHHKIYMIIDKII